MDRYLASFAQGLGAALAIFEDEISQGNPRAGEIWADLLLIERILIEYVDESTHQGTEISFQDFMMYVAHAELEDAGDE